MTNTLKPHSPAWFAALSKQNPQQAQHTRRIVELAGSAEVCSVCGDDPAQDYRVASANSGAIDTIRLCDDCRAIRLNMGDATTPA